MYNRGLSPDKTQLIKSSLSFRPVRAQAEVKKHKTEIDVNKRAGLYDKPALLLIILFSIICSDQKELRK